MTYENMLLAKLETVYTASADHGSPMPPSNTTENASEPHQPTQTNGTRSSSNDGADSEITEEQKARIEANRLKALEKAAAMKQVWESA
ncbi:hypothetical protein LINPERHAP1_LOCUS8233 [Linum perenne]